MTPQEPGSAVGVAPGERLAHLGQVVVRTAGADREERDARVDEGLGSVDTLPGGGPLDRRRVGPDGGAVLGEDRRLPRDDLEVTEAVPDVGVLRDQAQRLLLAAASDEDRDVARGGGVADGEAVLDPGQV